MPADGPPFSPMIIVAAAKQWAYDECLIMPVAEENDRHAAAGSAQPLGYLRIRCLNLYSAFGLSVLFSFCLPFH